MSTIERGYNLPTDNYTIVPNAWARDDRMSRRARGLLIELMSHRAGWKTSVASLAKSGPEGEAAIKSAIKELETLGYLTRHVMTDERGRRTGTRYVITDPALKESPSSQPSVENRPMGQGPSGDFRHMDHEESGDSPLADFPPVADHPTKKNTLQEEHLEEDLQEEECRRRVVDGTHDRARETGPRRRPKIDDLETRIRGAGLWARFDGLSTAEADLIDTLISVQGIDRLVAVAVQMHRKDDPARSVKAWLPTWRAMPVPHQPATPAPKCTVCEGTGFVIGPDDLAIYCECRNGGDR